MIKTINKLCNGLEHRRFLPMECEGMIDDILAFFSNEKYPSRTTLNQELEDLGWGIGVFDNDLYALTIPLHGNGRPNEALRIIRLNPGKKVEDTAIIIPLLEKAAV